MRCLRRFAHFRFASVAGLGLVCLVALAGPASAGAPASATPAGQPAAHHATPVALRFENGFVREMPPGHPVSGAFFSLVNDGEQPVRIVGGRCDCADSVELHAHKHANGVVSMEAVAAVDVAPGKRFDFLPGGHHVMLIGLTRPLRAGDEVTLTLVDAEQHEYRARLPVIRAGESVPAPAGDHHHH